MFLSRWIVKQGRLGLGWDEVALRSRGLIVKRSMCMVVAFDEEPLAGAPSRNGGLTRARKDLPAWLPSTASRSALGSIIPSHHSESQAARIDGKAIADEIKRSLTHEVSLMKEKVGAVPGIAMVRVGDRKDSILYVRGKEAACAEVGINSYVTHMPDSASEAEILEVIDKWNGDARVHGILVQLPLPSHIKQENVLKGVSLEKDVDGLHPVNLGRLSGLTNSDPTFVPCTPLGCMELLVRLGIEVEQKKVVVIGCSSVVGFPTAILLQKSKAEVTVLEPSTPNPIDETRKADIVISATGVPGLVRGHWLKPGAVVIDVGTSAIEDSEMESGFRVIGDVNFEEAATVASAITPVPGGVGPMTIAMLLSNTVKAARRSFGLTTCQGYSSLPIQ
ncbi:unnamed protein product [Calypogeia fissa]